MNCCDPNTKNIQLLEPTDEVLVSTASGVGDASLDERGDLVLTAGQTVATITFQVPKASDNYIFEYLYVDAFGKLVLPGIIDVVVVFQNKNQFGVEFAGVPPEAGYVLRWRAVVIDTTIGTAQVDLPESLRVQIPANASYMLVTFHNPRSSTAYGFIELRVENLVESHIDQTPILVQVVSKSTLNFGIGINPRPLTNNYFLVARTP